MKIPEEMTTSMNIITTLKNRGITLALKTDGSLLIEGPQFDVNGIKIEIAANEHRIAAAIIMQAITQLVKSACMDMQPTFFMSDCRAAVIAGFEEAEQEATQGLSRYGRTQ